MKFISLFSGIGGFDFGAMLAGHECVGYVEIDKYAHQAFQILHDPNRRLWNAYDIRSVSDESIRELGKRNGGGFNLSLEDFLAKASRSLENVKDLPTLLAELYSLKSSGSHLFYDLNIYFLRTSKDSLTMKTETLSKSSSARWMKWGMTVNGKCLTAQPGFLKTESEHTLKQVLEDEVPEKYFLSDEKTANLLKSLDESKRKAMTISDESTEWMD